MSSLKRKNKYVGAPTSNSLVALPANTGQSIRFEVSPGRSASLNFSFLDGRPQIQHVFFEYFRLVGQSVEPITNVVMYRSMREFIYFLDEYEKKNGPGFRATTDLDRHILLNFRLWLETRPRKGKSRIEGSPAVLTTTSLYNNLILLLNRLRRHNPESFPLITSPLSRMRRPPSSLYSSVDVLSMKDLKKILKVAIDEIDGVRARFLEIQSVLQKTEALPIVSLKQRRSHRYWCSKENAVHSLIRERGIMGPKCGKIKLALNRQGTSVTEVLSAYVPTGERSLLPFALQLSVQTGLNVSSLVGLTRDCIQDFALPQYKRLIYDKARSRSQRAKSQLIPASSANATNGSNAGPVELIEFLMRWTEPLLEGAPDRLKNHLFLFRAAHGIHGKQGQRLISKYDGFHASMGKFLADHPELPRFALKDLRPAVATYIYLTTRDVFRVKRFLGHSSIRTTVSYVRGCILATEHDLKMAEGIERMISRLLSPSPNNSKRQKRSLPILATVVEVGSTFDAEPSQKSLLAKSDLDEIRKSGVMTLVARCRKPDEPPAFLKVPPGHMCTQIFKCLNCPNATVLEEDLPTILLRLKHIWAERERLSLEGWQVVYGEAWATLNQVVRLFSHDARERAEKQLRIV